MFFHIDSWSMMVNDTARRAHQRLRLRASNDPEIETNPCAVFMCHGQLTLPVILEWELSTMLISRAPLAGACPHSSVHGRHAFAAGSSGGPGCFEFLAGNVAAAHHRALSAARSGRLQNPPLGCQLTSCSPETAERCCDAAGNEELEVLGVVRLMFARKSCKYQSSLKQNPLVFLNILDLALFYPSPCKFKYRKSTPRGFTTLIAVLTFLNR